MREFAEHSLSMLWCASLPSGLGIVHSRLRLYRGQVSHTDSRLTLRTAQTAQSSRLARAANFASKLYIQSFAGASTVAFLNIFNERVRWRGCLAKGSRFVRRPRIRSVTVTTESARAHRNVRFAAESARAGPRLRVESRRGPAG